MIEAHNWLVQPAGGGSETRRSTTSSGTEYGRVSPHVKHLTVIGSSRRSRCSDGPSGNAATGPRFLSGMDAPHDLQVAHQNQWLCIRDQSSFGST